jgi:hypothetical protein
MGKEENDLAWATVDELIAELFGRFDHVAFTGMTIQRELGDGMTEQKIIRRWKGSCYTVAGLADHVGRMAVEDFMERNP